MTGSPEQAGTFLRFGTVAGDFDTFRGLDLGDGAYLRPVLDADGYRLVQTQLPGGMTVQFPTAAAADDFFAQLSGKRAHLAAGTPVTIDVLGHRLTGAVTVGGSADVATLDLDGASLSFGDPASPLAVLAATGPARLLLSADALTGQLTGHLVSTVPGVMFEGLFTVSLDTATGTLTATGVDVALVIAGHRIALSALTVTAVRGANGWALHVTGPSGAVVTLGSDAAVTAQLLGALDMLIGPDGLRTALPAAVALAGVPGADLGGAFDLVIDSAAGDVSLAAAGATLTAGGATLVGDLTLRPVFAASGAGAIAITFGVVDLTVLGGLLVLLGLAGGTFLLTRSGVSGGVSGATVFAMDGLAGSAGAATVELNTTGIAGQQSFLLGGAVTTVSARGPPVVVELSSVHAVLRTSLGDVTLSGAITITGSGTAAALQVRNSALTLPDAGATTGALHLTGTAGTLTATAAGLAGSLAGISAGTSFELNLDAAGGALLSSPPAVWQVVLDGPGDHQVVLAADGGDIVVTVDGVANRRSARRSAGLTIAATGRRTAVAPTGALPVPVTFAGGTGSTPSPGRPPTPAGTSPAPGSGTVASVTFSGVEQLVGAADNEDVFAFAPGRFDARGRRRRRRLRHPALRRARRGRRAELPPRRAAVRRRHRRRDQHQVRRPGAGVPSNAAVVELNYGPQADAG